MSKQLLMHARVRSVEDASETLRFIELEPVRRKRFPSYRGGAHVNLRLSDGRMRQYSLCGVRNSLTWRIAVRREDEGRGVSRYLHDELQIGEELHVSYPQENFLLCESAGRHRFIAGGVGVTPIVGMLFELEEEGKTAQAVLHYLVRNASDAVFAEELRELGFEVHIYPPGEQQRSELLNSLVTGREAEECLYVCGPPGMIDAVLEFADAEGWPEVRYESFAKPATSNEVLGEPFSAYLSLSKQDIAVGEKETLIEALNRAGTSVYSSCEGGLCGTCIVDFEEGDAIHKDNYLSEEERKALIVTCVSRGRGKLKLTI